MSRFVRVLTIAAIGGLLAGMTAGCSSWSRTGKGAAIGGAVGAGTGAVVSKDKTKGAVIGGAAGAVVGGIIGHYGKYSYLVLPAAKGEVVRGNWSLEGGPLTARLAR